MERELVRRPSFTESTASSGCDVTFDDVDDSHVFAYLDDGDDQGSLKSASPRAVEFRLDFSSRVNPVPPVASTSPPSAVTRRSSMATLLAAAKQSTVMSHGGSTTGIRALQRSPSMRTNAQPFRKRLSRRPSEPAPDNALVAAAIAKSIAVRPESPPRSPTSVSSSSLRVDSVLPMSVGPTIAPAPIPLSGFSPTPRPPVTSVDDAMATAHTAALAAAASEVNKLQAENEKLREELRTVRSDATELSERLYLAEQHNESLSDQLVALQDVYEDKLRSALDDAIAERHEWRAEKESELQALRARTDQEREMLETEMKVAVAKIESDLQSDAHQLQRLLRDGKDQTNALKTQIAMLQAELKAARAEKQQQSQSDASLVTQCGSLQRSADHWEQKCQCLQDQVHQLLHEQDDWRRQHTADKQEGERKRAHQRATHERFALQLQLLQSQLKGLATSTRELIQAEAKKTTQLVTRWQLHASEVAIQHNEKAMVLVVKQNRIIQLETQLKNERQSVAQLDTSLAKTTRAMQRKDELFRVKYQEQKEFLDITVAVRNGLTHELQNKKKKLDELEMQLRDVVRAREVADKKNKHVAQQVKIMQHVHAREMEQVALGRQHEQCVTRRRSSIGTDAPLINSHRHSSKGAVVALKGSSGARGGVPQSRLCSSSVREPLGASTSTVVTTDTTMGAGRADQERDIRDRDEVEDRGQQWLPEDGFVAAEEWHDFVEVAALHEAECRYQEQ